MTQTLSVTLAMISSLAPGRGVRVLEDASALGSCHFWLAVAAIVGSNGPCTSCLVLSFCLRKRFRGRLVSSCLVLPHRFGRRRLVLGCTAWRQQYLPRMAAYTCAALVGGSPLGGGGLVLGTQCGGSKGLPRDGCEQGAAPAGSSLWAASDASHGGSNTCREMAAYTRAAHDGGALLAALVSCSDAQCGGSRLAYDPMRSLAVAVPAAGYL